MWLMKSKLIFPIFVQYITELKRKNKIPSSNNINSQLDATNTILFIKSINFVHPQEHRTVFTACGVMYRQCCLLVTSHQQAASSVFYTTSCKHSPVLRKDEIIARNMLSWLKLLIKLLLFHLVGCLYYCINDARSHNYQTSTLKFFRRRTQFGWFWA